MFPTEERLKGHIIHLTQVVLQSESHNLLHLTDFLCGQHAYILGDWGGGTRVHRSDRHQSYSVVSESLYLSTGKCLMK